jgi:hypothetical protein
MIKAKQEKEIAVDQPKEDNKHVKEMLPLLPPYLPVDATAPSEAVLPAQIPPQQLLQLAATEPSLAPNDMKTGYIISHLIDTIQPRYIHLTGIKSATTTKHADHYITEYFGQPTRGDPLDNRQQISIYITFNKHPIHNYKRENKLWISTVNDYDANDVDYNILMMLGTTQSATRGCHLMYLAGAVLGHGCPHTGQHGRQTPYHQHQLHPSHQPPQVAHQHHDPCGK